MSSIYKYISLDGAVSVLSNNSVALNNPQNYNDPFDCKVDIDSKDVDKCVSIITEYVLSSEMLKILNNKDIKESFLMKPLIKLDRFILETNFKQAIKQKYYVPYPVLYIISKLIIKYALKKSDISIDEIKEKFLEDTLEKARNERDKFLISCFGKRHDSILMWSHYADKHKGVCIEFERPNIGFIDVNYSNKRYYLDIEYLTRKMIGYQLAGSTIDPNDKGLIKKLIKPFIVKSRLWKYEKEVRCIFAMDSKGVYEYKNHILYKMPTKIRRIYIGCKVDKNDEKYKQLIEIADEHKIHISFMKVSNDSFKLETIG